MRACSSATAPQGLAGTATAPRLHRDCTTTAPPLYRRCCCLCGAPSELHACGRQRLPDPVCIRRLPSCIRRPGRPQPGPHHSPCPGHHRHTPCRGLRSRPGLAQGPRSHPGRGQSRPAAAGSSAPARRAQSCNDPQTGSLRTSSACRVSSAGVGIVLSIARVGRGQRSGPGWPTGLLVVDGPPWHSLPCP